MSGLAAPPTMTIARSGPPTFSIVIPTFSRPDRLRRCLSALSLLDVPGPSFEVIVVDDGGPSGLDSLIGEFSQSLDIHLVDQPRTGPGPARNAGAARARGRVLAFLDDDCAPEAGWLRVLAREMERYDRHLLGGSTVNAASGNRYAEASELIAQFVYDYGRSGRAFEPFFRTNNLAMPTALFREVGGFTTLIPSATAEDKEFCDRWIGRGLSLAAVPEAIVQHAPDLTFDRFLRQHYNYGRGILAFRLLRRRRRSSRLVPEPFTFYAELIGSARRDRESGRRWQLAALVTLAQLATVAGAIRESLSRLVAARLPIRRTVPSDERSDPIG
jgi:glycosyltransferase involved in cell wall biosynthesis